MSNGRRLLRQNTRERLISSDYNRMQAFIGTDANNIARGAMLRPIDDMALVGSTFTAAGPSTFAIDVQAPAAPNYGGVIDGLMIVVPVAGTAFLVTEGQLLVIDPDGMAGSSQSTPASADDSICKYVQSAGVQVLAGPGSLPWTANAGPGTRMDVIECQRTDVVQEVDNRDIFNPSTGLFTPTAVTKVTDGGLQFRVRLGVAGGGLPAPALGWFPLAVVSTPAGAASLDNCTVWDVRDLLSDRALPNAQRMSRDGRGERKNTLIDVSTAGQVRLSGQCIVDYGGYRFGGLFYDTTTSASHVRLDQATYQSATFVATPNLPVYVYALYPSGYYRWVQYWVAPTPGAGGRTPGPYRGVLAVSHTAPLFGAPVAPVALPSALGFTSTTTLGQVVASTVIGSALTFFGSIDDGQMTNISPTVAGSQWRAAVTGVVAANNIDFNFTPNSDFPYASKRVRLTIVVNMSGFAALAEMATAVRTIGVYNNTTGVLIWEGALTENKVLVRNVSGITQDAYTVDVPVANIAYLQPSGSVRVRVSYAFVNINAAGPVAVSSAVALVGGWSSSET